MISYLLPTLIFKKKWTWFADPIDDKSVDMTTFFSYNDTDAEGFIKKQGITSIINLNRTLEEIWGDMRKKFICEQITKGERRGILVEKSEDFNTFFSIYDTFRKEKKLPKDPTVIFRRHGTLLLARYNGLVVAGGIFLMDHNYARAWVLASLRLSNNISGVDREIIGQANRMVIWEAIKYAHKKNLSHFDMGGINDKDSALTEFKEGFGGIRKPNFYYTKIYSPILSFIIAHRK